MLSKHTALQNATDPSPHVFRISGVLENSRIKFSVENNYDLFFFYCPFSPLWFAFFPLRNVYVSLEGCESSSEPF